MTRTLRFLSLSLLLAHTERERTAVHGEMMALFPGHVYLPMRERNGWWDETACDNFVLRSAGRFGWRRQKGRLEDELP